MRPGDWNCPSCQHLNFSRRDTCQRCSEARPGDLDGKGAASNDDWLAGDSYGKGRAGDAQSRRGGGGGGGYGFGSSYNEVGKTGSGSLRPGDWYCPASACGAHNFASRSSCYKCGEYKEEGAGGVSGGAGAGRGPRSNYGFGAGAGGGPGPAAGNSRQGWKAGDWICGRSGCTEHNFASRMECYRCNAPRQPEYEVAAM